MYKLPPKLDEFTPYEPLVGNYPIRLDVNESFIEIPLEKIVIAIKHADLNRYPDPYATKATEAFSALFDVSPQHVTAGNGSDELIALIAAGLLQKGAKVLTLPPDFSMYGFYAKLYELEVTSLLKPPGFEINVDEVIRHIKENGINCLMFSNPCNPTSLGIDKGSVLHLVKSVPDTLIVVDEAYMDFWDESESLLSEVDNYSNLIVLRTCSKSVALAGIRLGFAVADSSITNALKTVKSPFNVNALSQSVGAAILSDGDNYRRSIAHIKENTASLKAALDGLKELGVFERVYNTKTNFVFAEVEQAEQIYRHLLNAGIAVRCFKGGKDGKNHLRICAGKREEMNRLCRELAAWKVSDLEKTQEVYEN